MFRILDSPILTLTFKKIKKLMSIMIELTRSFFRQTWWIDNKIIRWQNWFIRHLNFLLTKAKWLFSDKVDRKQCRKTHWNLFQKHILLDKQLTNKIIAIYTLQFYTCRRQELHLKTFSFIDALSFVSSFSCDFINKTKKLNNPKGYRILYSRCWID